MTKELINATEYIMSYENFKGSYEEWTQNVWKLYNRKNNWRSVLHLDILQGENNGNGFYPNFIKLIVRNVDSYDWKSYLDELKYGYQEYSVKVQKIIIDEYNENIDEYVLIEEE